MAILDGGGDKLPDRRQVGVRDFLLYAFMGAFSVIVFIASVSFGRWADTVESGTDAIKEELGAMREEQNKISRKIAVLEVRFAGVSADLERIEELVRREVGELQPGGGAR